MKINIYRPQKSKNLSYRKTLRIIWRVFLILAALFFISGVVTFAYFAKDLPSPEKLEERQITESTKIYDRTGEILLYDIHGEEKRTVISLEKIPIRMRQAAIAIEDNNFYNHFGLDFKGILRAALENVRGKKISQGGSTITQQFIKNSILTPERTFSRKMKEAILAIELEIRYSKDQILEFYFNEIPYGANAYGVEAASQTYFEKPASDLTLAESALLAAIPKAPTYYSPFGEHPEELKTRQEYILNRMAFLGYISEKESQKAKEEKLNFSKNRQNIKAPHFVFYVRAELNEKYGEEYMEKAGLKVITTLDWELQKTAEEVINEIAPHNEKQYNAKNAALVATDPKTGEILTMVGSRNYSDLENDGNVNVAIRDRQPGSSFKPFAYATAFKKGYTPETILFDLKTEFNPNCNSDASQEKDQYGLNCYHPNNYDLNFRGPVSFRQALAQSLNIPSVKVLYLAGVNNTINTAQDFGITTLKDRSSYGLALVLGGGEVKLLDMTSAYGVFATEGLKYQKSAILKIEDNKRNILEEYKPKPISVIDPQISRQINNILSDNEARTPTFGEKNYLTLGERPVAAKTGTTQEFRDAWTVGYTPSLVVGVWVGNNDNSKMYKAPGAAVAAPIWNKFMKLALKGKNIENFNEPEQIITEKPILNGNFEYENKIKIDKVSEKLATEFTPPEFIEEKIYREIHNILYYIDKDSLINENPVNPENDPLFNNWEAAVLNWAKDPQRKEEGLYYNETPPTEYDDVHTPENQPIIKIISPREGEIIKGGDLLRLEFSLELAFDLKQADIFFDENFIASMQNLPYLYSFHLSKNIDGEKHSIKINAYDKVGNRGEKEINIFIIR